METVALVSLVWPLAGEAEQADRSKILSEMLDALRKDIVDGVSNADLIRDYELTVDAIHLTK